MRLQSFIFILFLASTATLFSQKEGYEYVNPPVTIVVLGSSTAEGIGTWPRDSSWVNRYAAYVKSFNPNNQVINLGRGGFSTYNILPTDLVHTKNRPIPDTTRNFTKALSCKPDGIIINLPSNDLANGFSVEEQLDNFRYLAQLTEEHNIELFVTTTQVRNFPKAKDRQTQRELYDSLRAIFYNNYIDFWTGFGDEDYRILKQYDSGDGCHINNGAHKILMDRVIESQAFAAKLDASALQQSTTKKPKIVKPTYLCMIGFDGEINRIEPTASKPTRVQVIQNSRMLAVTEVTDAEYNIEVEIDLRFPFELVYRDSNAMTKIIAFDLTTLDKTQLESRVYYPIEHLDIDELSLDTMNHRFKDDQLRVAEFWFDSINSMIKLDTNFSRWQKQRIEDALLKPSPERNKSVLYWENGKKKAVLKFKDGQLNGKSKWYREDGTKERYVTFLNGFYEGKYQTYHKDGSKNSLMIFKNDIRVGDVRYF